jgi:hypothetical protein
MNVKKKERIALLVEPRFQGMLLLYVNALTLILIAVIDYGISRLFSQLEIHLPLLSLEPEHPYLVIVQQQRRSLWALYVASSALVVFLANVGALVIGHRIAGPIYRIRMQIQSLRAGSKGANLKFRKTDFFKHLEKEWNEYFGRDF